MKTLGLVCLILGVVAGFRGIHSEPPQNRSEAYRTGYNASRIGMPVVLVGLGLWLLLRDGTSRPRTTPSLPTGSNRRPQRPPPPPLPASNQIPVKIHCTCGQNYSFDVEPVAGRMPTPVACPACGADGTETANAYIAGVLATRTQTPVWAPATAGGPRRKLHPALIVALVAVGLLAAVVVISSIGKTRSTRNRPAPIARPQRPPEPPTGPREGVSGRTSRPGSTRDAAPVPPNVTAVEVLWGNRWWPATILRREGERAFIHYDGWNSSYDEWATPERLRPRR